MVMGQSNLSLFRDKLQGCNYIVVFFSSGRKIAMKYNQFVSDFNEYDLWDCIDCVAISHSKDLGFVGGVYLE